MSYCVDAEGFPCSLIMFFLFYQPWPTGNAGSGVPTLHRVLGVSIATHSPHRNFLLHLSCFFFFLVVMGTRTPLGSLKGVWGGMGGKFGFICLFCFFFVLGFLTLTRLNAFKFKWFYDIRGLGYASKSPVLLPSCKFPACPLMGVGGVRGGLL